MNCAITRRGLLCCLWTSIINLILVLRLSMYRSVIEFTVWTRSAQICPYTLTDSVQLNYMALLTEQLHNSTHRMKNRPEKYAFPDDFLCLRFTILHDSIFYFNRLFILILLNFPTSFCKILTIPCVWNEIYQFRPEKHTFSDSPNQ